MQKLSFDYNDSTGDSSAEYRGLTVKAIRDESPSDPWKDMDGLCPILWTSGERNGGWREDSAGRDIESPLAHKSAAWISRNWPALVRLVAPEYAPDIAALLEKLLEEHGRPAGEAKRAWIEERLADERPSRGEWGAASDYLDSLAALWNLAEGEAVALSFQSNGYSQGDSVLGLLVATPKWRELVGLKLGRGHEWERDLESQSKLFGAYMWGDVYGFEIAETGDSVWGYYGDDFEESGLAETAREFADSILASAAERRARRLAELIRNRVPLEARPAILAEASRLESIH